MEYASHNKFVKIKVLATVYADKGHQPSHGDASTLNPDDLDIPSGSLRPNFELHVDNVHFALVGPITLNTGFLAGPIVVNRGTAVSGSYADTKSDDLPYYTVESAGGKIEIEVTSEPLNLQALDSLTVPFIVRSHQVGGINDNDITVEISIYNPDDPLAEVPSGFRKIVGFAQKKRARDIDRSITF